MAVQISLEGWLIGREMDASKKSFVATRNLVFDFELFIGGRFQLISNIRCYVVILKSQRKFFYGKRDVSF